MSFCENLPRRNSCQIFGVLKKKIKICLNLIKKNQNSFLDLKFFFNIWNLKSSNFYKKLTFPFGNRIKIKKVCLITKKKFKKKKKLGRNLDQFNFAKKLRRSFLKSSVWKNFFFILQFKLEKKNQKLFENFFFKNQSILTFFKLYKDFSGSVFKSLSSCWYKFSKGSSCSLKIFGKNCVNKSLNNIIQLLGNSLDFIPSGISGIKKISLKPEKMPNFMIFLS